MPDTKAIQYRIVDLSDARAHDERGQVVERLAGSPAGVAPRYFYDELGCALYAAICRLPEYYPTRTEAAIFHEHRTEMAATAGRGRQLVDLGAGDCVKARWWIPFLDPVRYVAVDIAAAEMERALARMSSDFAGVEMLGVVTDFARGLPLEEVLGARAATFFYPGSSIGNFTPGEALAFLRSIHTHCARRPGSGLLIGVDGKKERTVLEAAYDDALGVTAAFNRNVLLHLNRRFGFDFDPEGYEHRALYNESDGRIEMHLESRREQAVRLGDRTRRFAQGERIHTENSYKYAPAEFEALLRGAGFSALRRWSSAGDGYSVIYAS